jgi:hypothetical protein
LTSLGFENNLILINCAKYFFFKFKNFKCFWFVQKSPLSSLFQKINLVFKIIINIDYALPLAISLSHDVDDNFWWSPLLVDLHVDEISKKFRFPSYFHASKDWFLNNQKYFLHNNFPNLWLTL